MNSTIVQPDRFRKQVGLSLLEIFGYRKSIFWLGDRIDSMTVCDPVYLNIKDSAIDLYLSQFSRMDFLGPFNLSFDKVKTETVIDMDDVVSEKELLSSTYYTDFLKRFNERRVMVTYLIEEDRIIGAISIVRDESERRFQPVDKQRLKIIARHLTRTLASNLLIADLCAKRSESPPVGSQVALVVFDAHLKVKHFNQAANEMCREVSPDDGKGKTPQEFVDGLLQGQVTPWRSGAKFTVLSSKLRSYTIHIVPDVEHGLQVSQYGLYNLYLYPKIDGIRPSKAQHVTNEAETTAELTVREYEVVKLVMAGLTNTEIASRLFISLPTVKSHLKNVFRKLDVPNRTSLCYKLNHRGFM